MRNMIRTDLTICVVALGALLMSGCGNISKSIAASDAATGMVGMSDADVLACMGPPMNAATRNGVEVWSYSTASSQLYAPGDGTLMQMNYDCTANIVLRNGRVENVAYRGNKTGPLAAPKASCGALVQNCVR